jgi:hypothetical protein
VSVPRSIANLRFKIVEKSATFGIEDRFLNTGILAGHLLLEDKYEMNSIVTLQKRLHDETAAIEKEIQSHNRQVNELSKRLEGLKRAAELFESEQAAIAELLQASIANGGAIPREMATAPAAKMQRVAASSKATAVQKQLGRRTQIGGGKTRAGGNARTANENGGLTRVDMIAAVLRRHPRRTVRELIALLDQEYRWKTTESAVTGHLYTRRDKFVHTQPDRSANRPVTWSLK